MRRIAALVPNKLGVSPGQRQRIEAWAPLLEEYGWQVEFFSFEDDALHEVLYSPGNKSKKFARMLSCYRDQITNVLRNLDCDGVFIYREAAMIGPSLLERLVKRKKMPVIYDIDDPIFLPYRSPVNGWLSLLKFSKKTHFLFQMSDHIIAINGIIGNYAKRFNPNVTVVPNAIDTEHFSPSENEPDDTVSIVWTGSVSTLPNLDSIANVLRRLQQKYAIPIRVVANGKTSIDGVELDHRKWSPEAELSNLQECEIGIVPLLDLDWNPWKFFLKTVQYFSVGLPVVARGIGSNVEVIKEGVNGFLVESEDEWVERLSMLIEDKELRSQMGKAARETALANYSLNTEVRRVANIFEEVYGGNS